MTQELPRFVLFGSAHLGVLALTVVSVAALIWFGRRLPSHPLLRWKERGLVLALLLTYPAKLTVMFLSEGSAWDYLLPLHLCDLAAYIAAGAIVWKHARLAELAYFWGLAGTLQGLLTPAVAAGYPHPEFFRFFLLHATVVIAAIYLPFGKRLTPRPGAIWRAFGWLQVYVVGATVINLLTDANYGFLRAKPPAASLMDVLGPWPWYILSLEALALALFAILYLPFGIGRLRRRRSEFGDRSSGGAAGG